MFTAIYESTPSITALGCLHSGHFTLVHQQTQFMKGELVLDIDRDHTIIITRPANSSWMGLVFIGANCTVLSALKREAELDSVILNRWVCIFSFLYLNYPPFACILILGKA